MDEYDELRTNTSSIGKVILEINQMCKKPSIDADLNKAIDLFTKNVNESDKYLENGIFSVNFTEAALFIQSATDFWSKKVDLLWDGILDYQKRIILYDKKNEDNEVSKLEERINRYRRKKTKIVINPVEIQAEELLLDTHEYDWHQEYETNESQLEKWQKKYSEGTMYISGESEKIKMKIDRTHLIADFPIYDFDDDPKVDDPVLYYKRWHGLDIVKYLFRMYDEGELDDELEAITQLRIDVDLIYKYRLEHNIDPSVPRETFEEDLQKFAKVFMKSQRSRLSPELQKARQKFCPADTVIHLQRLPLPLINEKLRRITLDSKTVTDLTAGNEKDKEHFEDSVVQEECDTMQKEKDPQNANISEIFDDSAIEDDENAVVEIMQAPPEVVIIDPLPEEPEPEPTEVTTTEPVNNERQDDDTTESVPLPPPPSPSSGVEKVEKAAKSKKEDIPEVSRKRKEVWEELESPNKKKKFSKKQIQELSTPIAEVKLSMFEKFYFFHYNSEDNEGEVLSMLDEDDDKEEGEFLGFPNPNCPQTTITNNLSETDEDEDNGSQELMDSGIFSEADASEATSSRLSQTLGTQESTVSEDPSTIMQETVEAPSTIIEESVEEPSTIPEETVKEPSTSGQQSKKPRPYMWGPSEEEYEQMRKNVRDWKKRIEPTLKTLSGNEFDIHEYGSNIMNTMEIGEVKTFNTITQGKSASEVVRFFISSLQLANTSNVEIGGAQQGKLSNDTFSLKLLKRDRYHEHLTEFEAPSEETFRERLKRMHDANPHLMSTPSKKVKKLKH